MPHYSLPRIELYSFPSGPLGTNCYLIICKKTKEAAVVDPASDSFLKVQRACQTHEARLTKLIFTHSHWDHIVDAAKFVENGTKSLLIHSEDAENLRNPGSDGLSSWMNIDGAEPSMLLKDGDTISVGEWQCRVIHTPGHSPGGICLFDPEGKILISGDTLFKGSIGRLDLPTGQPERMWPSLKKLAALAAEIQVFPGHGPPTTIGAESWLERAQELFG